ncbi:caspase family protein [Siccirubricoccus sp. KC 17139]|uniref:Caspase family protein n=1 Tax=Siccirubricoccus soli TaxID=2899147 RepID=A0ABT1DAP4_9PROT|nr:caspase family protein [Siccirubricoccus soli]MCO6419003.1 caspase family protein [Siccirubricoccus soli]MCP2685138.1 caspase family protein [Siccirubricoccus soli]
MRRAGPGGLALLAAGLAGAAAQEARQPPQAPILRVEAAAHTAHLSRLATDGAGRLLVSVSDDKTARLWSLPEGTPRGVLRPPIGPDAEGELYAVALSADGRRAFLGGHTCRAWDGAFCIYVFDTETRRMVARLPGLPAPVLHLAVSPDGTRLAAALDGRAGIRVWDARNGQPVFEDTAYGGAARMLAFDAGNRLAVSAADGRIRLYEAGGRKLAEKVPLANASPYGLALSPDGGLLAVGYEDRLRIDLLALPDLRTVLTPDVTGLAGEGLPAVTWAADGQGGVQLHAAGYARRAGGTGGFVIRRWADFGLGPATDIPAARDAIPQLLRLPRGGLAFAADDPGWGRLAPDGGLAQAPRPVTAEWRLTAGSLAVSADAQRVRFALAQGAPPLVFDVAAGRLSPADPAEALDAARTASPRIPIHEWRGANRPRFGTQQLRLNDREFARSLAILPREDGFLLGTDTQLRRYDAAGRPVGEPFALPGAAWGLAVAADGTVVAALGDGTLRWYDSRPDGRFAERGALFPHADGRRWVLFTPEGLFDHAPEGGQDLVGVHLNAGRAQTPEWASFRQAYRALFAPAETRARIAGDQVPAVARLAGLGAVRERIGQLPLLSGSAACAVAEDGRCTPLPFGAAWIPPGATALRLTLTAQARGLGLGPLDVVVNDRIAARGAAGQGETTIEVPLDPGPNRVATRLYAEDRGLFAEGPVLELRREGEAAPPPDAGRLLVLAIGVDHYANPELNLRFAVADARTVAETLKRNGQDLFRSVEVTLLTDAEASRAGVLAALDRLAEQARPEDTFVLYIAGHGLRTEPDRRFLFLPADVRDISSFPVLRPQALDDEALVGALARVRARDGFLFIDTCHAGQLTVDSLAALGNETGRFLLAASTSVQEALDSYDERNGLFAVAVREGLTGRAAMDGEGRISALALGEWVTRRVPVLAAEKRHRQDAVFRTAQRDLRSFPLARAAR